MRGFWVWLELGLMVWLGFRVVVVGCCVGSWLLGGFAGFGWLECRVYSFLAWWGGVWWFWGWFADFWCCG